MLTTTSKPKPEPSALSVPTLTTKMPKPLPKIEDLFEEFAKMTGYDCCAEHKYAARKIFYCGFSSSLKAHQELAELDDEQGARALNGLMDEASAFMIEMLTKVMERRAAQARGEPVPPMQKPFVSDRGNAHGKN